MTIDCNLKKNKCNPGCIFISAEIYGIGSILLSILLFIITIFITIFHKNNRTRTFLIGLLISIIPFIIFLIYSKLLCKPPEDKENE